jgi:hypothetical protein
MSICNAVFIFIKFQASKLNKKVEFFVIFWSLTANDLHASDGRDTEALNCKPITNL